MKKRRLHIFWIACFLIISVQISCSPLSEPPIPPSPNIQTPQEREEQNNKGSEPTPPQMKVHFLDVGQAESILIQSPSGKTMLIDAGNNDDGPQVITYIKKQGISKLDIVIGTHPHEDHIGGLDTVINTIAIDQIIMPKVSHTTKTYRDVLTAIQKKGLKITTAKPGLPIDLGLELKTAVLAPIEADYDELNNYSVVIRLVYGQISFLFTGDAEKLSENQIIASGAELSSTVLKVGHHGSSSSTSQAFLKRVSPQYAVIMAGEQNEYGHPHQETVKKLKEFGTILYRTDQNGTIVAASDGSKLVFY